MFHCVQLPSISRSQSVQTKEPDDFRCVCGWKYFRRVFRVDARIVGTLIERKSGDDTLSVSHQCARGGQSMAGKWARAPPLNHFLCSRRDALVGRRARVNYGFSAARAIFAYCRARIQHFSHHVSSFNRAFCSKNHAWAPNNKKIIRRRWELFWFLSWRLVYNL